MQLFHFLPVLSLLLRARASSLDSREPAPHHLDVRDTSDVCAVVSGFIYFDNGYFDQLGVLCLHYNACFCVPERSTEDVCTCLSTVNAYVESLQLSTYGSLVPGTLGQSLLSNLVCGRFFQLMMVAFA